MVSLDSTSRVMVFPVTNNHVSVDSQVEGKRGNQNIRVLTKICMIAASMNEGLREVGWKRWKICSRTLRKSRGNGCCLDDE